MLRLLVCFIFLHCQAEIVPSAKNVDLDIPATSHLRPKCKVKGDPLDLLIVLDVSASSHHEFNDSIEVVKHIMRAVAIGTNATRMAMVTYATIPRSYFHFNTHDNRFSLEGAIDKIKPMPGLTITGVALAYIPHELTTENGMRTHEVPKIIFLITDGFSMDRPDESAKILREQYGQRIWAFGVGRRVSLEGLISTTNDPNKVIVKKTLNKIETLFLAWKGVELCEPAMDTRVLNCSGVHRGISYIFLVICCRLQNYVLT